MRLAPALLFIGFLGAVDKAPDAALMIMAAMVAMGLERSAVNVPRR